MDHKNQILTAVLDTTPEHGWSWEAFGQAAINCGLDPAYPKLLFPEGLPQALASLSQRVDQDLYEAAQKELRPEMRVPEKITCLLELYFQALLPHHRTLKKIARFALHPARAPLVLKMTHKTVNEMWYLAGDASTDYNYYTKRFLLGYVHRATWMYFLKSKEPNTNGLRIFIQKRLHEVAQVPKLKSFLKEGCSKLKSFLPNPFRT